MLACYARNEFPNAMIKIPAFVIGGLLILTGIAGYVLQDPGLSLKITGPLAEDAQLVLSDGKQKHELDLGFASSDAAGEHAYWLIYNLNRTMQRILRREIMQLIKLGQIMKKNLFGMPHQKEKLWMHFHGNLIIIKVLGMMTN